MTVLLGRARAAQHRLIRARQQLRSPDHTVMEHIHANPAPAPRAFAGHHESSWLVPPCEVVGAHAIAVGDGVVVLEHGSMRVLAPPEDDTVRLTIGDRVRLGRFLTIVCQVGIEIGEAVSGSDCVTIIDTEGDVGSVGDGPGGLPLAEAAPVRIRDGAYLGYGCVIGPGVEVGEGAFVGEGAVVHHDVAPYTVVYGNPAAVVRRYDRDRQRWEGPLWP